MAAASASLFFRVALSRECAASRSLPEKETTPLNYSRADRNCFFAPS